MPDFPPLPAKVDFPSGSIVDFPRNRRIDFPPGVINWLSGWNYRRTHIINSASGAGTGYQVPINVFYKQYMDFKDEANPLYDDSSLADWICMVESGGTYYMFYSLRPAPPTQVRLATSTDGRTFTYYGVMISAGGTGWRQSGIEAHTIIWDPVTSKWTMYCCGYAADSIWRIGIFTATSLTGPWSEYAGNPVLSPSGSEGHVADPNVIRISATDWRMYYCPAYAGIWQVSLATSTDGYAWTKYSDTTPLMTGVCTGARLQDSTIQIIYDDGAHTDYDLLVSTDGINFSTPSYITNPIVTADKSWEYGYLWHAGFLEDNEGTYIYYSAGTINSLQKVGRVLIRVDTYGAYVLLDGKCKTDFGDIRLTASDGLTLLDYWIERYTSSKYAVIWIEISDNLTGASSTIYLYYGKADATTTHSLVNTFPFFNDDMETDFSKWVIVGSPELSTDYNHSIGGTKACKIYADQAEEHLTKSLDQQYSGYSVMFFLYDIATDNVVARINQMRATDGITEFMAGIHTSQNANTYTYRVGASWYNSARTRVTGWRKFEFRFPDGLTGYLFIDGKLVVSVADPDTFDRIQFGCMWSTGWYARFYEDDICVRKYVSPEPSHGAWGEEET